MEKTLMLHCPFSSSQSFLLGRFPKKDVRFITALGGLLPWDDELFLAMLETFLVTENIQTIYFVQDLQSKFLREGIRQGSDLGSNTVQEISKVFGKHLPEILTEGSTSGQVSKLSLFLMEEQTIRLYSHPPLQRLVQENNIQVKGILSDQSKSKSIEFQIQPALQFS